MAIVCSTLACFALESSVKEVCCSNGKINGCNGIYESAITVKIISDSWYIGLIFLTWNYIFLNSAETFMHCKPHICADPSPRNFSTSCDWIPSRISLRTAFTLSCSFIVVTVAHRGSKVKDKGSMGGARRVTDRSGCSQGHWGRQRKLAPTRKSWGTSYLNLSRPAP